MKTLKTPVFLTLLVLLTKLLSAQIQYLSTVPPYNGGNGSSMVAFNVKAKNSQIEIKELYCTFSSTNSQTTTIYYRTDSINGSPSVTTWLVAGTVTHTPTISGIGTMSIIPVPNLSIIIPAGAVYGFAISGSNITYTGTGSTPTTPWLIEDSNIYINMGASVGWGGTAASPIQYRHFNGRIGYELSFQETDASLQRFVFPTDTICGGSQNLSVVLKNNGPSPLNNVEIHSKINNVAQPVFNWTGNLAVNDSANVVIGSHNFSPAASYSIEAYTSLPNTLADTSNHNDTVRLLSITVLPELLASLNPATTADFCDGDSVPATLSTSQANTFQWYYSGQLIPGATDSVLYIKQAGPYTVWYSDGICHRMSDTLMGISHTSPIATLSAFTPTTFCHGDSVWLFANTGTNIFYKWERNGVIIPGETNSTYPAKESGDYVVITTNPGNCSTRSNIVTVNVKPTHPVNLGQDMLACEHISVTLDAGPGADTYLWSTGETTQTINVDTTGIGLGDITLKVVTSLDGCISSDSIKITFVDCTGIQDHIKQSAVDIYPNPNNGSFTVRINSFSEERAVIKIYDITGKLVYSEELNDLHNKPEHKIMHDFPKGVYLLNVEGRFANIVNSLIVN